jgi:hypothetical protein
MEVYDIIELGCLCNLIYLLFNLLLGCLVYFFYCNFDGISIYIFLLRLGEFLFFKRN